MAEMYVRTGVYMRNQRGRNSKCATQMAKYSWSKWVDGTFKGGAMLAIVVFVCLVSYSVCNVMHPDIQTTHFEDGSRINRWHFVSLRFKFSFILKSMHFNRNGVGTENKSVLARSLARCTVGDACFFAFYLHSLCLSSTFSRSHTHTHHIWSVKSGGVKPETLAEYIQYLNVGTFNLPVCGDDMLDDALIWLYAWDCNSDVGHWTLSFSFYLCMFVCACDLLHETKPNSEMQILFKFK